MTKEEFRLAMECLKSAYTIVFASVGREFEEYGDSRNIQLSDDLRDALSKLYKYGKTVNYINEKGEYNG